MFGLLYLLPHQIDQRSSTRHVPTAGSGGTNRFFLRSNRPKPKRDHSSNPTHDVGDGSDDPWIGAAAADISAHPEPNFLTRICMAFRDAAKARHNLSRRTVPALEALMLYECRLKRM